jgi:hypothetical protein
MLTTELPELATLVKIVWSLPSKAASAIRRTSAMAVRCIQASLS